MTDRPATAGGAAPLLLQVCANDHPPFADICRYHAVAAAVLSWRTETVMLEPRGAVADPAFHYPPAGLEACLAELLGGAQPVLTLCHRYRAYRAVMTTGIVRSPVVAVAHEFGFFRRRRRRWQRRWDRLRRRPRVAFAGISDAVAAEIAAATGEALLLPNGIDLPRADAARLSRADARARLGLSGQAFAVGVVGRLHPKKRPELAVAAFARAAAYMPEAELVLVGDGELAATVRRMAKPLPVTLAGFVPEAGRLMAAFDLLLLPSGSREAFGMVALEAMAAAVPVLSGPAPGPRFVLGDTGRWFVADDPDEAGRALLALYGEWRNGTLEGSAGAAARGLSGSFRWPPAPAGFKP